MSLRALARPPSGRAALLWVLGLALVLRLGCIALAPLPPHEGVDRYDDNRYDALAWSLAQGKGYRNAAGELELKDPPMLPFVAAGLYRLFGHQRTPVHLLQALLSVATVALVFHLARRHFGEGTALAASALTAINLDLIVFSNILLTETIFIFLLCAAVLAWERALEVPTTGRWALTGALLGASALARPTAQLLVVGVGAITMIAWRAAGRPPAVRFLLVALIAFMLVLTPWTVRNYLAFHRFVPVATGAGIGLWVGTNVAWHGSDVRQGASIYADPDFQRVAAGDPVSAERRLLRESIQHVADDPAGMLWLVPDKLLQMLRPGAWLGFYFPEGSSDRRLVALLALLYYPVLLLACVGSVLAGLRLPAARPALLRIWTPIAYIGLLTLATIPARRYMLPVVPFLHVLASMVLLQLLAVWRRGLPLVPRARPAAKVAP